MRIENLIVERYNERLRRYGFDPRTLGWFKGRQRLRFHVLSEIGDLNGSSVLDVGCGFGDLYGFLTGRGLKTEYTGIDINPKFIEIAEKTYREAHFEVKDVMAMEKSFDWVLASGLFEFKVSEEGYVQKVLKKMFEISNKGVAANFMSSYVDFKQEDAYYADPEEIFSFCKTLTRRITLRHDYMPFEFSIYIYKDDRIDEENVFKGFKWKELPD